MCISLPKFVPQTFAPSVSSRDCCLSFPTESEEMNGDILLGEKSVTASDALFRDSSISWEFLSPRVIIFILILAQGGG